MRGKSYFTIVITVFAIAAAMRLAPLVWSPLPSTLDGFVYVSIARDMLATGAYPIDARLRADHLVLTLLTGVASAVTGKQPLYVIQPLISVIGAAVVIAGIAIVRRLATNLGWTARRTRHATLGTGLLLAVEGLFLRRTTEPDPEVLGMLLTLLSVIALYRILWNGANRWAIPFIVFLFTFPILHIFSTFNAAVALTTLLALAITTRPNRRTVILGSLLVAAFWAVFIGYYELVQQLELFSVSYVGRVRNRPGLFVAWLLAAGIGAAWFQRASSRVQRFLFVAPLAVLFTLVVVNTFVPIYPGTIQSPPEVAILISLLAVPVAVAGYAAPALSKHSEYAPVVLALLVGPLIIVYFSLTAALTPDYFATGMRAQTFMHVPAFVLVGIGAVGFLHKRAAESVPWRAVRTVVVIVLFTSTLFTAPLAFVSLDTFHHPATISESEFDTAGHANTYLDGHTTDHVQMRLARQHPTGEDASVSMGPTQEWLRGGGEPQCAVVSLDSWVTHGAYFFPSAPQTIDSGSYQSFINRRNLIYANSGRDPLIITKPRHVSEETKCSFTPGLSTNAGV